VAGHAERIRATAGAVAETRPFQHPVRQHLRLSGWP
jgi:hypothetical protein